jgi:hypothetical protein
MSSYVQKIFFKSEKSLLKISIFLFSKFSSFLRSYILMSCDVFIIRSVKDVKISSENASKIFFKLMCIKIAIKY